MAANVSASTSTPVYEREVAASFKLVFLTLVLATVLFAVIGAVLSTNLVSGTERATTYLFDLSKWGFGGVLGLVGGKVIK